jgi:hypothetical protein
MPVNQAIWKVGKSPEPLAKSRLETEQLLEEMIVADPRLLSDEWMLIGRQETTDFGGRIDLLGITPDASLVLIELKRDKTPREIAAQALDYASWVENLEPERVAQIYRTFSGGGSLGEAFEKRFGFPLDEETLNQSHQILIVAAELDDSTERILAYLNARDVAINVMLFQVFSYGKDQLLSRAWLIDPGETQANVATSSTTKGEKEPWNGEYYVSFGYRNWEEARKYGFICGGGGAWYSRTLKLLHPKDRVWVRIPKKGFVGVGIVEEVEKSVKDFTIKTADQEKPAIGLLKDSDELSRRAEDPEKAEHFVRIKWLDSLPESEAYDEIGFFGNQNTVCRPETPKWRYTIDRLKTKFTKWDIE